jgi:hypothetical protein
MLIFDELVLRLLYRFFFVLECLLLFYNCLGYRATKFYGLRFLENEVIANRGMHFLSSIDPFVLCYQKSWVADWGFVANTFVIFCFRPHDERYVIANDLFDARIQDLTLHATRVIKVVNMWPRIISVSLSPILRGLLCVQVFIIGVLVVPLGI